MTHIPCRRCGACCARGGPALHSEDLPLLEAGHIALTDLYCIRAGELAHDPRYGGLVPQARELLKIRGKADGWECVFFDPGQMSCAIYTARPLECRTLSCTDSTAIFTAMSQPCLGRADCIAPDSVLGQCIAEHEALFPVAPALALARAWTAQPNQSDQTALSAMVSRELHFRLAFAERVQVRDAALWVYFGRPLWQVLAPVASFLDSFGQEEKNVSNC